jgi:ribosomal subunit interface protein
VKYNLSYHHVDHSSAFEEFLTEKVEKMGHLMTGIGHIDFIADKDSSDDFKFSVNIKSKHNQFYSSDKAANIYQAASKVIPKMKAWLQSHQK